MLTNYPSVCRSNEVVLCKENQKNFDKFQALVSSDFVDEFLFSPTR